MPKSLTGWGVDCRHHQDRIQGLCCGQCRAFHNTARNYGCARGSSKTRRREAVFAQRRARGQGLRDRARLLNYARFRHAITLRTPHSRRRHRDRRGLRRPAANDQSMSRKKRLPQGREIHGVAGGTGFAKKVHAQQRRGFVEAPCSNGSRGPDTRRIVECRRRDRRRACGMLGPRPRSSADPGGSNGRGDRISIRIGFACCFCVATIPWLVHRGQARRRSGR